jgi:hypothetical protein
MFCAPRLIFDGTEGVGSRFHVVRSRIHFRRYRGRRVPFSCFAISNSFSAVPRASCPVFMFCAPRLIFGGTECVESDFHVLRSRTRFRWYRGRRVPFSHFTLPDSFSAVAGAWGPFFLFCAPDLNFRGTEGVESVFHVFRSRTCFRRNRGRRVLFSRFALPDSFSIVPRASGPVFTFSAPGLDFGGNGGLGSHFLVFRARTLFRRYQERRVPFSCFASLYTFSAVPRASSPFSMFLAPGPIFGGIEVGSRFQVLRARTRFRRYRGRRVPFSRFAPPESFSMVPWPSGPIFLFCALGLGFAST